MNLCVAGLWAALICNEEDVALVYGPEGFSCMQVRDAEPKRGLNPCTCRKEAYFLAENPKYHFGSITSQDYLGPLGTQQAS